MDSYQLGLELDLSLETRRYHISFPRGAFLAYLLACLLVGLDNVDSFPFRFCSCGLAAGR